MQSIEPLKSTDGLGEGKGGIWKKWPWKDLDHYELMSDLILSITTAFKTSMLPSKTDFLPTLRTPYFW